MLGTKTKQINSYGKQARRIINVSEEPRRPARPQSIYDDTPPPAWAPVASRMKKRENEVPSDKPPKRNLSSFARGTPVRKPLLKAAVRKVSAGNSVLKFTPPRAPLASFTPNAPGSPAVLAKTRRKAAVRPTLNKPFTPFVEVDIIVLDDDGNMVSQERRVSRTAVESSPSDIDVAPTKRKRLMRRAQPALVVSDDSDSDQSSDVAPKPRRRAKKVLPISDDSDSERPALNRRHVPVVVDIEPLIEIPDSASISDIITPAYTNQTRHSGTSIYPFYSSMRPVHSPVARPRQLTPIRGGRAKPLVEAPSPATTSDLSFDFDQFSLDENIPSFHAEPEFPEYLRPLLEECNQANCGIHEFSAFLETFPMDPVVQSSADRQFRKIGEASYSEVFGIGDVVLKIIPIRDTSENRRSVGPSDAEEPYSTDPGDVLKELIVTRAMGQVCDGFVELLKTYVVRGRYPERLLDLWDEYYERKGSESIRPDTFTLSQVYVIIVLPNGGPDLEAFVFANASKTGWRQACSIFWQVAKALAHAEKLVSFEHRDLHLGQILVKSHPVAVVQPLQSQVQNQTIKSRASKPKMDSPLNGVTATLIDLGLARMDAGDGSGGEMVHYTAFDETIFTGEGDYQFDIYRMMKAHIGGKWEQFHPLTNVMWLHYLVKKLLRSKRLRAPAAPRKGQVISTSTTFTEKDCHSCLVDLEDWLGKCLADAVPLEKKTKGKKKVVLPVPSGSPTPSCAGEIVEYGEKKGWVKGISSSSHS
ncbi:hypothetical protein C8J56DRAFT_1089780 [Mycena floridula]|nr:hypothetical protein C8J56DRAFT_1089780 [Mycena floridula]